jgi:hypothetical protein
VILYLKRTETHCVKSRKEAVDKSPWAKFVTKALLPDEEFFYRYTCFEFIGDYQAYLKFQNLFHHGNYDHN